MKKQVLIILLIVAGVVLNGCKKQEKEVDAEALLTAANELDRNFIEAYNNGDLERLMSMYWNSPDLYTFMPGGSMMAHGYEETKKVFMEDFKNNTGAKITIEDSENRVEGDVVLGHGTFTWTLEKEGQEPIISKGRYTDVKAMKDDKMVFIVDHASVPMMPPPPLPSPPVKVKPAEGIK
jgi:ketosteroid isomerase-like protein